GDARGGGAGRRRPVRRVPRVAGRGGGGGPPGTPPATSEAYVRSKILGPLGVERARYEGWRCAPAAPEAECRRIARWLAQRGPMDLCLLGLGRNGHLLMNEPAASLRPGPHVARLAPRQRRPSMLQSLETPPAHRLLLT